MTSPSICGFLYDAVHHPNQSYTSARITALESTEHCHKHGDKCSYGYDCWCWSRKGDWTIAFIWWASEDTSSVHTIMIFECDVLTRVEHVSRTTKTSRSDNTCMKVKMKIIIIFTLLWFIQCGNIHNRHMSSIWDGNFEQALLTMLVR